MRLREPSSRFHVCQSPWPLRSKALPARMSANSAGLTAACWEGSSRNQAYQMTAPTSPTAPKATKTPRQAEIGSDGHYQQGRHAAGEVVPAKKIPCTVPCACAAGPSGRRYGRPRATLPPHPRRTKMHRQQRYIVRNAGGGDRERPTTRRIDDPRKHAVRADAIGPAGGGDFEAQYAMAKALKMKLIWVSGRFPGRYGSAGQQRNARAIEIGNHGQNIR